MQEVDYVKNQIKIYIICLWCHKKIVLNNQFEYEFVDKRSKKTISYDLLSSGEKKIIWLIESIVFARHSLLLFDEPDLSLSIVWQEMLLDDIIKCPNYFKVIICTQSPSLLTEDKLEYIIEVKKWKITVN